MPVILAPQDFDHWLGSEALAPEILERLLVPHPVEGMEAYPVSRTVNSPANDTPECVQRVEDLWG
jgi:putative SOS response-associated peptidase YedK